MKDLLGCKMRLPSGAIPSKKMNGSINERRGGSMKLHVVYPYPVKDLGMID